MTDLSKQAKVFILATIFVGLLIGVYTLITIDQLSYGLLLLTILAAVAQVLKVEGSTNKSNYTISWMIYGFCFVMMGVPSTLFIILIAHLVEWAWHKYPWYIQFFNIANFAISLTIAGLVREAINPGSYLPNFSFALATLVSLATFTVINHAFVGLVIWLARGQNISQSGVFGFLTLMIDFTLIGLGTIAALVWKINPFMIVFAVIPIYLIYSTLRVPALQRQTQIDPKTKLYNANYFADVLKKELDRALSFNRPLTVVLGDLDLLRNINNTYGHLAGDVVLIGVAELLREKFRGYDLVARFGGEEFAILMPETTPEEAFPRIEVVRQAIEAAEFEITTSVTPIKATISFGVAGLNEGLKSADEIVHNADVSLYLAKLIGRNTTCIYSAEGSEELISINRTNQSIQDDIPLQSRLDSPIMPFQPNPLREQAAEKANAPEKTEQPKEQITKCKPRPPWMVNMYVGLVALAAVGLASLSFILFPAPDWFGVIIFSLIIMLTEGLSIDIYVKETSISTASAPLIAGALLYGPLGALVLSLVLAATSMIKHRSKTSRLIFNTSNHFISSSLCSFVFMLSPLSFTEYPVSIQIIVALLSGSLVFFSSTLLISGVMSISMEQPFAKLWNERFRWLWAYYMAFGVSGYVLILGYTTSGVVGLAAVLVPLMALRISQIQYIENTKSNVTQLRTKNSELEKLSRQVENFNEELLLSLANIIDLRDTYTMGHSAKVAVYAGLIAREMGLPGNRIELLHKSSLLHDIGKIGIPDSILFKPSELTFKENEIIKEHPERGATIVTLNQSLQGLAPIIRHHHERYDGRGYPDGLRGEDIPLEARILCLADAVQAMTSDRIYRKSLQVEQVKTEIEKNTGTQFDPKIAHIFLDLLEKNQSIFEMTQWESSQVSKKESLGSYIYKETAFMTVKS